MTLIIIALLTLSALALLGSLFFLYRYVMRSHLFPQLPRVWRVEKKRFLMCLAGFIILFAGFLLTSWSSVPEADIIVIDQTLPIADRPSFDGAPPPEERALPPLPEERVRPSREGGDNAALTEGGTGPRAEAAPAAAGDSSSPGSSAPPENLPPAGSQASPPDPRDILPSSPAEEVRPSVPESPLPPAGREGPPEPVPANETGRRGNTGGEPEDGAEPPARPELPAAEENRPAPQPKPYVPGDDQPAGGQSSPAAPAAASGGGYSVCVSSYSSEEAARRDQPRYRKLGQVFIVAADIPGKGRWYRICVGQYDSRTPAQNQATQWRGNGTAQGAFVVMLPAS
ncbi:MAG: SPOR domain-containing protein [Desulfarculales bacterium]|jgi:hypothetical protein|nr:SPOR domain-containing protein [Desulfarculales bacterium]